MPTYLVRSNFSQRYNYTAGNVFTAGTWGSGRIGARFASAVWTAENGSTVFGSSFPNSRQFRIQAARLKIDFSPSASESQLAALLNGFATLQLRFTSQVLASATDWQSTESSPVTLGGAATSVVYTHADITRAYRVAWAALGYGAVPGIEFRTADLGTGSPFFGGVSLEMEVIQDLPDSGNATLGGETVTFTQVIRPSTGLVTTGASNRFRTFAPTRGVVEVGAATRSGLIFQTSGLVAFSDRTRTASYWRTSGRVAISAETTDRNRYVTPLRLRAGRVVQDVGYMWVPVYLQLPVDDHVSDWPWEFYYPDGTKIPHMVRNRVGHQVRALVYMRPSVTQSQDFFCRVG
jgi:hypothetical protein